MPAAFIVVPLRERAVIDPGSMNVLRAVVEAACRESRVDAASLAVHSGGEVEAFAAGLANVPEGVEATVRTLFHIGSVTKAVTAELIWRLIGDGRLSADQAVIDAAPELGHVATLADRRLTIRHLLSHTGGLDGDVIFEAGRGKDVLRRFMAEIGEIGSLFAPGARFSYANVAYNVLARIAEVQGGEPFEDAVGDLLRKSHGLTDVALLPEEKLRHRTAVHFSRHGDAWLPSQFGPYSNIGSGTILAMSMSELARWGVSLLDSDEIVRRMTEPAVQLPFSHRYEGWGYGVSLLDGLGSRMFGHDGGTAGTSTFLRIAPAERVSWAFAATGSGAGAVHRQLEPLLRDALRLEPARRRVLEGDPPRDLRLYEGRYERHGMTFTIEARDDGTLSLVAGGSMSSPVLGALSLRPLNAQVFEAEIPALDARIWVSFHDFATDARPRFFYALERMARRAAEHAS